MSDLLKSWVESANSPQSDFPLNNLPYGVFSVSNSPPRCGVAIGELIVDVALLEQEGLVSPAPDAVPAPAPEPVFGKPHWNAFMQLGPEIWAAFRTRLQDLLTEGGDPALSSNIALRTKALVPAETATLHMPFQVSEYTDFYASRHHATNVGTMFRGAENALPPNWLHIPIGYNGRASSVYVSGTNIRRPWGQIKGPNDATPRFAPSERFDFELEMGAIVGTPSTGQLSVAQADQNIFGYVLLNDWSARDIQAWEYQPLGPFQAKATATSISPWIVTTAALEPFRCDTPDREVELLEHLKDDGPMLYDIALSASLSPQDGAENFITQTNHKELYYSAAQQLAHHASCGCAMNTGDLLGSGTISGPEKSNRGSLLELSWGGKEPFDLADGTTRSFVEDGDTLTLRGHATGNGYRIGFGACTGTLKPALAGDTGTMQPPSDPTSLT